MQFFALIKARTIANSLLPLLYTHPQQQCIIGTKAYNRCKSVFDDLFFIAENYTSCRELETSIVSLTFVHK